MKDILSSWSNNSQYFSNSLDVVIMMSFNITEREGEREREGGGERERERESKYVAYLDTKSGFPDTAKSS